MFLVLKVKGNALQKLEAVIRLQKLHFEQFEERSWGGIVQHTVVSEDILEPNISKSQHINNYK